VNVKTECYGEVEKLLIAHQKKYFSHIKSTGAYLVEMARQRAEKDMKGE